jgi:hypothetical protein
MSAARPVTGFLTDDHARLGALFARAVATPGSFDREAYDAFRAGLLRPIAIEEKVLFPAAREARAGEPLPEAARLRIDHGAIAALLVPPPSPALAAELRIILDPHELIEEEPGGVYDRCEELLAARALELVEKMRTYPPVKVAAYFDGPRVVRTAADALALMRDGAAGRDGLARPDSPDSKDNGGT